MPGQSTRYQVAFDEIAAFARKQPAGTRFYVRGFCRIDHPTLPHCERLISGKVSRAAWVSAAMHMQNPSDVEKGIKLPVHLYVDGTWRALYLGE